MQGVVAAQANKLYTPLPMVTGRQIRAALGLLDWTLHELAEQSGVPWHTVRRMTKATDIPTQSAQKVAAVEAALVAAGVEFIEDDGVKLRRPSAQ